MSGLSKVRGRDRISELSDAILCDILSLLDDTKASARTSILSSRWKNIWHNISSLSFLSSGSDSFNTTVNHVLSLRGESGADIKKLTLWVNGKDFSHVDGWIQTAATHNLLELDLVTENTKYPFELPESIFTCNTLKVLKLELHSDFTTNKIPASGCFRSLKHLELRFDEPDSRSMEKLFIQCPVLDYLSISGFVGAIPYLCFNISAPELKRLKVELGKNEYPYEFFINAPKLEYLSVEEDVLSWYYFNSSSLMNVHISINNCEANSVNGISAIELFTSISETKCLFLSANLLWPHGIPTFYNLKTLMLRFFDCNQWVGLPKFLLKTPNLECLTLIYDDTYWYDDKDNQRENQAWKKLKRVPNCLLSNVKIICIYGFRGRKGEIKATKYLLEKCVVLEKMKIISVNESAKKVFLKVKEAGEFRKCSKTCRVSLTIGANPYSVLKGFTV